MPNEFICGPAGYGKSYLINQRREADPDYAVIAATTGVAAMNLGDGATTINSLLGYFDEESLKVSYQHGWVQKRLARLAMKKGVKHIVIDETSMLSSTTLDLISKAVEESESYITKSWIEPVSLVLTGDFCQLPPVKGKFAFRADCWADQFEANITKLTKCYRQTNENFLKALQAARVGQGVASVVALKGCGIEYKATPNPLYDGTTLFSVNRDVTKFNEERFAEIKSPVVQFKTIRRGKQKAEWKVEVPDIVEVKAGALVLILANEPKFFRYVNGDLAEVLDVTQGSMTLKLKRDGYTFKFGPLLRENVVYDEPREETQGYEYWYDERRKGWVIGDITYLPLRLGYASTIHKCQGLTMDKVQLDVRHFWAGGPAMMYVAMSRVRTPEGLSIVGNPGLLARRITADKEALRWA